MLLQILCVTSAWGGRRVVPRDADGAPVEKAALIRNAGAQPEKELDCAVKALALEYATTLLNSPFHVRRNATHAVKEALDPTGVCNLSTLVPRRRRTAANKNSDTPRGTSIYVAPNGSDSNSGASASSPLKTLHAAQRLARQHGTGTTVYLDAGRYDLASGEEGGALQLDQRDAGTTWSSHPGEEGGGPVISGGRALRNLQWTPLSAVERGEHGLPATGAAVFKTTLPADFGAIEELSLNGARQIRARFPNANPEYDLYPHGYLVSNSTLGRARGTAASMDSAGGGERRVNGRMGAKETPRWAPNVKWSSAYTRHNVSRPTQPNPYFQQAHWLTNGGTEEFDPPWAWTDGMGDWPHNVHGGINFDVKRELPRARTYTAVHEVRLRAFHDSFWGNWGFLVHSLSFGRVNVTSTVSSDSINVAEHDGVSNGDSDGAFDGDSNIGTLLFSGGGWQEATGTCGAKCGPMQPASWFIENVKQELDAPLEWYFDPAASLLLYAPADGAAPQSSDSFVAAQLKTLVTVNSSAAVPGTPPASLVRNITLNGLTFVDAAPTFYERYSASGPGDWSIYPGGALYVRGVEGLRVTNCVFDSLGGNALFMHDWVKHSHVLGNEFRKLGDSAIAATGWLNLAEDSDPTDQTAGRFPSDNVIEANHVHNIGIYGKQVACYHQTIACHNVLRGNVCYDGPRAAINFNDGMGGGNTVEGNLIFNMVRETDDHGPFNSWSRIPFNTLRGAVAPKKGALPAVTTISRNFFIMHSSSGRGTTGGLFTLCHDDGSAFYNDTYNFLVYGGVKNYLGEQNSFQGNVIVQPDAVPNIFPFCLHEQTGHKWNRSAVGGMTFGERFVGNTCIMSGQTSGIASPAAVCASACVEINYLHSADNISAVIGTIAANTYVNVGDGTKGTAPYFECAPNGEQWSLETMSQFDGWDDGAALVPSLSVAQIVDLGRTVLLMPPLVPERSKELLRGNLDTSTDTIASTAGANVSMCHGVPGWQITFDDEFNGDALNATRWTVADNTTHGNTEQQLYVKDEVSVANGLLTITTRKRAAVSRDGAQYNFTSGWVDSKSKVFQKFGRFEVRAKLPTPAAHRAGKWPDAWPAHWLMPEPTTSTPPNICWPVGGEIDIMEGYRPRKIKQPSTSGDAAVLFTYHWAAKCGEDEYDGKNEIWPRANDTATTVDWSGEFHTFGVEWSATKIEWFVDGVLRHVRVTGSPPDLYIPQWPFYVILNTALTPWSSSEADVGYPLYHVVDRVTMCKPVAARSISTSR